MAWTVHLALLGWIPAMLYAYASMVPRRAMILSFVAGWMFLPNIGYDLPGLPDYTKATAAGVGALLGTLIFDTARLGAFRLRLLDVPMVAWCLCPFMSSMTNDLGPYDGVSAVFEHLVIWGLPYFLGRIYLTSLDAVEDLALAMLIGGLVYVPLCLFEIRMSPQLGYLIYGLRSAGIGYAAELGKWGSRPFVFMDAALTVGVFMTAASLIGIWVWRAGRVRTLGGLSLNWLIPVLVFTTVLCKNMGALALLLFGLAALFLAKWSRISLPIWLLVAAPLLYMSVRATGQWDGAEIEEIAGAIHPDRAGSFRFRLKNEDLLVEKAFERPVVGWGKWGRNRVYAETEGQVYDISVSDGLWVAALGQTGIVGLASLTGVFLLPVVVFLRRFPVSAWTHGPVVPAAAIAVVLVLYMIDNLFNAMVNPIYIVAAGGMCSVTAFRPFMPPGVQPNVGRRVLVRPC